MVFKSEFYGGSRVLNPIADWSGLQIDQVNFMASHLVALALAFPFRKYFSAEIVGARTRHIVETVVGVLLTIFCFGYQIGHLLVQSLVSYAFMAYGGRRFSHAFVFAWSMIYLSVCHIYRQVYDYGGFTMDITGPLMIQTQKLTALAFALHDGRYKDPAKLSQDQKTQAVSKLPNMLQYLSYMFFFHGFMIGPTTFYNDYMSFINGTNYNVQNQKMNKEATKNLDKVVLRKLLVAAACCFGMLILPGLCFPPEKLNTPEFYRMSYMEKMIFVLGCLTLAKQKYYFAWKLTDAINNAAGLGFSGFDKAGNAIWDLTDNVDIIGVELSTSLKNNIDSWNTKTIVWLRRVVYDRLPRSHNTLAVFFTSALWHGFYPGYYFTFLGGSFFISTGRMVRRRVRPVFQQSPNLCLLYDGITFTVTRFSNAYLCFPFLTLTLTDCLSMYSSMYFSLHLACVFVYLFMKALPPSILPPAPFPPPKAAPSDKSHNNAAAAAAATPSVVATTDANGKPSATDEAATDEAAQETTSVSENNCTDDGRNGAISKEAINQNGDMIDENEQNDTKKDV